MIVNQLINTIIMKNRRILDGIMISSRIYNAIRTEYTDKHKQFPGMHRFLLDYSPEEVLRIRNMGVGSVKELAKIVYNAQVYVPSWCKYIKHDYPIGELDISIQEIGEQCYSIRVKGEYLDVGVIHCNKRVINLLAKTLKVDIIAGE